jgi:hypothetical protein
VSASASATAPPAPPAQARNRAIEARRAARLEKFKRERLVIDYLNRGVSVREIAFKLGVTEKRMRAIVKEVLAAHMPAPPEEFVALQISRLNEALLVAYSAMSGTNLKAVDRVVRIARELDRYHGFFPAERRTFPDGRHPALTEAKAEEPLAILVDRSEMAMQMIEMAQSAPGNNETADCQPREGGNPESPGANSPSFASLRCWMPAWAGTTGAARPEMAPQALENAQSAPENDRAPDCHPRESGDPESPCANSPSFVPLRYWTPARAGMTGAARPEMAPQALENAQSAPGNSSAPDCHPRESGDPESPCANSPSFVPPRPWMPACAGMTDAGRSQTTPQAIENAQSVSQNGAAKPRAAQKSRRVRPRRRPCAMPSPRRRPCRRA